MLLIKGDDPEPWRAVVLAVQERSQTVQVQFYVPHPRWGRLSDIWVCEGTHPQQVHFRSITGRSAGNWQSNGQLFKEL